MRSEGKKNDSRSSSLRSSLDRDLNFISRTPLAIHPKYQSLHTEMGSFPCFMLSNYTWEVSDEFWFTVILMSDYLFFKLSIKVAVNESRIKVAKTGCITLGNSIFPEVEFGHEGANGVMMRDNVHVFLL